MYKNNLVRVKKEMQPPERRNSPSARTMEKERGNANIQDFRQETDANLRLGSPLLSGVLKFFTKFLFAVFFVSELTYSILTKAVPQLYPRTYIIIEQERGEDNVTQKMLLKN